MKTCSSAHCTIHMVWFSWCGFLRKWRAVAWNVDALEFWRQISYEYDSGGLFNGQCRSRGGKPREAMVPPLIYLKFVSILVLWLLWYSSNDFQRFSGYTFIVLPPSWNIFLCPSSPLWPCIESHCYSDRCLRKHMKKKSTSMWKW